MLKKFGLLPRDFDDRRVAAERALRELQQRLSGEKAKLEVEAYLAALRLTAPSARLQHALTKVRRPISV